jgi:hypothetical protein
MNGMVVSAISVGMPPTLRWFQLQQPTALGMPSVLFLVSANIKITVLQNLVSYLSMFTGVRTDSTHNANVSVNKIFRKDIIMAANSFNLWWQNFGDAPDDERDTAERAWNAATLAVKNLTAANNASDEISLCSRTGIACTYMYKSDKWHCGAKTKVCTKIRSHIA